MVCSIEYVPSSIIINEWGGIGPMVCRLRFPSLFGRMSSPSSAASWYVFVVMAIGYVGGF